MLLLLLALLGPHAREAQLHANDPEGAWVRARPALLRSFPAGGRIGGTQ